MSLKSKFKTNSNSVTQGVWVEYKDSPNEDGSVPKFKVARQSGQNKNYSKALRTHSKKAKAKGKLENMSDEESNLLLLNVFVDSILLGWENFQPNDDGVSLEFSALNATAIFGDPDWYDFYQEIQNAAEDISTFNREDVEEEAKN